MREVNFVKDARNYKGLYEEPTKNDHHKDNVITRLLEIDKLDKFSSFGDRNLPPSYNLLDDYEPFTVISEVPSEIYYVDRNEFLKLLPKPYTLQFKSYPNDYNLRKRYYEQRCWKKFKSKVFSTLIKTDKKRNSFNK